MTQSNKPTVALALGGGGVRGLAHLGVLKVLEREQIPIAGIAGTSAGGLIGAAYASGMEVDEIEEEIMRIATPTELIKFLDIGFLKGVGLITGSRIRGYLETLLGKDLLFSDLKIPFVTNAVCLDCCDEVILREGSVVGAMRASMSIPGVFAPVEWDDCRLVDGGVLNNLPADLAGEFGADAVIAVDVSMRALEVARSEETSSIFTLSLANDLWQTVSIMTDKFADLRLAAAQPDVIVRPIIPFSVSMFSGFGQAADVIAAGMNAAEAALPEIEKALA